MASNSSLNGRFGAAIAERDMGWRCSYCYKPLDPSHAGMFYREAIALNGSTYQQCFFYDDQPCVDHVVPRTLGGPTELDNLVLSCRSCNSRKLNKLPGSF